MQFKIQSGGQTGVDISGLKAATFVGFNTGGWLPKGFKTLNGPKPEYISLYSMKEHEGGYKERTGANVRDSDLTLRLAVDFNSPGERCTLNWVNFHKKPHFDINLNKMIKCDDISSHVGILAEKIIAANVKVLNIAGNCDKALTPSKYGHTIEEVAYFYLVQLFTLLRDK